MLSLLTRIDELAGQNKALLAKIDELLARIAKLEGRAGKPRKTPTNSSLSISSAFGRTAAAIAHSKQRNIDLSPGVEPPGG